MLARAARPKLTLSVPTITSPTLPSACPKSPFPSISSVAALSPAAISPAPSPTARNTMLNTRGFASTHLRPGTPLIVSTPPPPRIQADTAPKAGILKKAGCACTQRAGAEKKISFSHEARVAVLSPMPADYHGEYRSMRGEGKW